MHAQRVRLVLVCAGEETEIQVRFTPIVLGPITMYGVCDIQGALVPTGFRISCTCRGLDVSYDLMSPEAYERWAAEQRNPRARRRRDDVDNFTGMSK
jgi:hypothetical protein